MALKPPKRIVSTVKDLIYWFYAELIAKSAGFADNYGFVISRFKKLKSGEMVWSSSLHDHMKEWDQGKICVYCGNDQNLSLDHIIPSCRAGCDPRVIQLLESIDNCVWACRKCNSSKGGKDVFEWFGGERRDEIPKIVLSKFLKISYKLHETQETLELTDPNMDGVLDIYDLGTVITDLIMRKSKGITSFNQ